MNEHTFDYLLKPFFLECREKSKPGIFYLESPAVSVYNLKWRAKFQIYRQNIRDYDWLNFKRFSGYNYKIKLVSILRKREYHALISISTILKFSAQLSFIQWHDWVQDRFLKSGTSWLDVATK